MVLSFPDSVTKFHQDGGDASISIIFTLKERVRMPVTLDCATLTTREINTSIKRLALEGERE
ncbi:MAG TPA: hypothetical protein VIZ18_14980, partial [Ktedonobacteraceae bacterium]